MQPLLREIEAPSGRQVSFNRIDGVHLLLRRCGMRRHSAREVVLGGSGASKVNASTSNIGLGADVLRRLPPPQQSYPTQEKQPFTLDEAAQGCSPRVHSILCLFQKSLIRALLRQTANTLLPGASPRAELCLNGFKS